MGLLVLRRVVLGVLGDVAELARFPNAVRNLAPLVGRQELDLFLELLEPVGGEDDFLQSCFLPARKRPAAPDPAVRRGRMVPPASDERQPAPGTILRLCRRSFGSPGGSATSRSRPGSSLHRWPASASR